MKNKIRSLFFDLLIAAGLTLLVISGAQVYQRFFQPDPLETLMEKYGSPSAGNPQAMQSEWNDLIKRAEAHKQRCEP